MNKYKCGNFTLRLLARGNHSVFVRDDKGDEFLIDVNVFDERYVNEDAYTPKELASIQSSLIKQFSARPIK